MRFQEAQYKYFSYSYSLIQFFFSVILVVVFLKICNFILAVILKRGSALTKKPPGSARY